MRRLLNNKGLSLLETLAALVISGIVIVTLTQFVRYLSLTSAESQIENTISNEGISIIAQVYADYSEIVPVSAQPCFGNDKCIILIEDASNKVQIGFIQHTDTSEKIEIVKTIDGVQSTSIYIFGTDMINTSITKSCLACPSPTSDVYVLYFDLYYSDTHNETFMTSFKTY